MSSDVGPEKDPFEKYYRVEEIEKVQVQWKKDKRDEEGEPPQDSPDMTPSGLAALISLLLEKIFGYLKQSIRKGLETAALEPAKENLLLIKAAFEMIKREDRSQDAQFLRQLSNLWQKALEHSIELQAKTPWVKQLKTLIKNIENYPENEEHTFGYYLEEYAGQKWLPFPYMELIQKLHHQYERDPPSSHLSRWTLMIEEILNRE